MTVAVIEINDVEARLSRGAELLAREPGYAQVSADTLLLGQAALQQARVHPLQTNNQFWRQLSMEEIPSTNPRVRHSADLVHLLLDQLCQNQPLREVVLAVPGSFSAEQLSLLLGIAQQYPFTAVGLVDSAVAGAAQCAPRGQFALLEMQLHQTVITTLSIGDKVTRHSVDAVANTGLLSCYESWAGLIADQFIQQTRFNPRHDANTEQALFNQLPAWLQRFGPGGDQEFELQGKSIQIAAATLLERIRPLYERLQGRVRESGAAGDGVLLNPVAGALPGLAQIWPASHIIAATAVAEACDTLLPHIRRAPDAISFISELPATATPVQLQRHDSARRATHLLWRHSAYPLAQGKIYIADGEQPVFSARAGTDSLFAVEESADGLRLKTLNGDRPLVNDQPGSDGAALHIGDQIKLTRHPEPITVINVITETNH